MSRRPSISSAKLCLRTSTCSWVTVFLEGWRQDLYSGQRKTLHAVKPTNAKETENPQHGSTSCAAALRRTAHRIMGLGQSLRDLHSLMIGGKAQGKLPGSDCGGVWWSGAEVSSTRRRSSWVNLKQSLQVRAWNVLSLREDDQLSLLSFDL